MTLRRQANSKLLWHFNNCRKVHTESCKKWLERLQVEQVPVLVCLTFADKLYAEHMSNEGKDPDKIFMKREVAHQLKVSIQLMWIKVVQ